MSTVQKRKFSQLKSHVSINLGSKSIFQSLVSTLFSIFKSTIPIVENYMFVDFYAPYIAQWQNNNNKNPTTYVVKTL